MHKKTQLKFLFLEKYNALIRFSIIQLKTHLYLIRLITLFIHRHKPINTFTEYLIKT